MENEFFANLSKALHDAYEGDNSQLLILEQMKEDAIIYIQSLLQIIESDKSLRSLALIELKNIIKSKYETFPPEFLVFLCDEHIKLLNSIDNPDQLRFMVPAFITLYDILGKNWTEFSSIFEMKEGKLPFQIEIISEILLKLNKNADFIIDNMEQFLRITLAGLQQKDWILKTNCIRITFLIAGLDPEAVEPHVSQILSLIQQSPELDEKIFFSLWIEFNSLIEVIELPEDQLQIVFQSAVQSLESEQLSNDAKVQALSTLTLLPFINEETAMNILDHSFNLFVAKAESGDYLDSVPDIYLKAIQDYGSQNVYNFLKEKITQSLSSETSVQETVIAFLYIVKSTIDKIEKEIKEDWAFINEIIEKVSEFKSEEFSFLQETCLMFISSLGNNFEVQLLQSHLFTDFSIPLIASQSVEVRQDARDAIYNALDSISVPVSGITEKILALNSMINADESEYMTLIAKSIEQEEGNFESEKAIELAEFLVTCFNGSNPQMKIGALSVSTALILMNETVHEILVHPTIELIQNCLISENIEMQLNGLQRMSSLYPHFKEEFSGESIEKVENLIQGKLIYVIEKAATCLSVIARESNQKAIIDAIVPAFQQWIIDRDENFFNVAVTSVQNLTPALEFEKAVELFGNICNVAEETKNEDIISDCFNAIGSMLSKTVDSPIRPKLFEISSNLAASFIQGKIAICDQSEPLDCDFDLETITSFANLLYELLRFDTELNELIFQFAQTLISSQKIDYIDTALTIIGDGVLFDAFKASKDKAFIVSYVQSLFEPNTDIILIQSLAYTALCLIEKGMISEQICEKLLPVILQWWSNIYSSMKEIMLPTLSNLSILLWSITLNYGQSDIQTFKQSFELFPPNDFSDTTKMCEMLIRIASNQQMLETFPIQITLAISRLLVLPKMLILKRDVSDEIISKLGEILSNLFKSSPEIQAAVLKQIGESQISHDRIMNFIQ